MPYNPDKHHRRSIRLATYDYTQPGAYFVTICAHYDALAFSAIRDGNVALSESGTVTRSLGAIIQNFKSVSTRKINQKLQTRGRTVWQRNYFERIIRNEAALTAARHYIAENPVKWVESP